MNETSNNENAFHTMSITTHETKNTPKQVTSVPSQQNTQNRPAHEQAIQKAHCTSDRPSQSSGQNGDRYWLNAHHWDVGALTHTPAEHHQQNAKCLQVEWWRKEEWHQTRTATVPIPASIPTTMNGEPSNKLTMPPDTIITNVVVEGSHRTAR
jgi:hypothetical protein